MGQGTDADGSVTDVDEADMSWGSSSSVKIGTEDDERTRDVLDEEETKKPWEIHRRMETEGWCAMLHSGAKN